MKREYTRKRTRAEAISIAQAIADKFQARVSVWRDADSNLWRAELYRPESQAHRRAVAVYPSR